MSVRRAAAKAAVTASRKTGRPVDPRVAELALTDVQRAIRSTLVDHARVGTYEMCAKGCFFDTPWVDHVSYEIDKALGDRLVGDA